MGPGSPSMTASTRNALSPDRTTTPMGAEKRSPRPMRGEDVRPGFFGGRIEGLGHEAPGMDVDEGEGLTIEGVAEAAEVGRAGERAGLAEAGINNGADGRLVHGVDEVVADDGDDAALVHDLVGDIAVVALDESVAAPVESGGLGGAGIAGVEDHGARRFAVLAVEADEKDDRGAAQEGLNLVVPIELALAFEALAHLAEGVFDTKAFKEGEGAQPGLRVQVRTEADVEGHVFGDEVGGGEVSDAVGGGGNVTFAEHEGEDDYRRDGQGDTHDQSQSRGGTPGEDRHRHTLLAGVVPPSRSPL